MITALTASDRLTTAGTCHEPIACVGQTHPVALGTFWNLRGTCWILAQPALQIINVSGGYAR